MPMTSSTLNISWSRTIFSALRDGGVAHVVVAPGSRSAPLVVGAAHTAGLKLWSIIDERVAGFFALGIARATGTPAAVVCTSGSALAHLLPAVVEAAADGVPLVLVTADRPRSLHYLGAPQTMEQDHVFGEWTRAQFSLSEPSSDPQAQRHVAHTVALSVATAKLAPAGPVHLNVPFPEPLVAVEGAGEVLAVAPRVALATSSTDGVGIAQLESWAQNSKRGVIICGPRAFQVGVPELVGAVADRFGLVVVAEATSNVRFALPRAVRCYEHLLKVPGWSQEHRPDLLIRIGGGLTTRALQAWVDAANCNHAVLTDDLRWHDHTARAGLLVVGDTATTLRALASGAGPAGTASGGEWYESWASADQAAAAALTNAFDGRDEPSVVGGVVAALGDSADLFVASSMPIRDADAFALSGHAGLRVWCNRGVNGIDGTISTAAGVSAAGSRTAVALVGDVAAIHDVGGFMAAARAGVSLTVVVINNDGGGIFEHLPVSQRRDVFEPYFTTPHGLSFEGLAHWLGAPYVRADDAAAVARAVQVPAAGLRIVEVCTSRRDAVDRRRLYERAVVESVSPR